MHGVFNMMFDYRLIFPPIPHPRRILECGYGSSSWAAQVAEQYPECEVREIVLKWPSVETNHVSDYNTLWASRRGTPVRRRLAFSGFGRKGERGRMREMAADEAEIKEIGLFPAGWPCWYFAPKKGWKERASHLLGETKHISADGPY